MIYPFLQFLLLVTFLLSGFGKLISFTDFKKTIEQLEINRRFVLPSAAVLVLLELSVSILLIFSGTQYLAYLIILFLLGCFAWSIYRAYNRQLKVACNCFGNINPESFGWNAVLRVVLLLVVTLYLLSTGTTIVWAEYPIEDIYYAGVGSIGVLLVYSLMPYAAIGTLASDGSK